MRATACPALSARPIGGSKCYRNAQKPPALPLKGKGSLHPFCKWGAERQKCCAPDHSTRRQRTRQRPASHALLPGRVFLTHTAGAGRGHLVIGLGSKHPTFPRKLTDVRASKKEQQKGARPFGVRGSRKQITKDMHEHSSQTWGSISRAATASDA